MTPFLKIVAQDLFAHFNGNFERVSVVFPNKRASLFFERHLSELIKEQIWAPNYHSLDDIFSHLSNKTVADPILSVCLLYKAHCRIAANKNSLSHFYGWGEVMLNDFNDIDNNMALADKIFSNVKDLEDLKATGYFSDNQLEAIQSYFKNYDPEAQSELKKKFQDIWSTLYPTYLEFRNMLAQQGLAYAGMQKREVIEMLECCTEENLPEWLKGRTFVFVGFNVLNTTERRLFMLLRRFCKVLFYWDYDYGYCSSDTAPYHEAGRFIRENLGNFPNKLDNPDIAIDADDIYNNLSKPKRISIVETSTEIHQARFAGNFLRQGFGKDEPLNETAIVLCNEKNLQPVLHSIPPTYTLESEDRPLLLNITMGYPLYEMPIAGLLLLLVEMQLHGRVSSGWRYRYLLDVLAHPYAKYIMGEAAQTLRDDIVQQRKYVLADSDPQCKAGNLLFQHPTDNLGLLNYLAAITQKIGSDMRKEASANNANDALSQLYAESVYAAYKLLNRLVNLSQQTVEGEPIIDMQEMIILNLLRTLLRGCSIPFHGEPAEGVQVLGLLETRNIDFRRIVMLATNEGTLPGKEHRASFIPYNLREAHGMTTMERQISLSAFYFYRLISRAEEIVLLYSVAAEAGQTGEMSRFLAQLLTEHTPNDATASMLSKQTTLQRYRLDAPTTSLENCPIVVKKDDTTLRTLLARYDFAPASDALRTEKDATYFSPSAINTYINCPLKFYFQYVVGLREQNELSDEIDNSLFGTIFHGCMELLYKECINQGDLQAAELRKMANNKALLEKTVDKSFALNLFNIDEERIDKFVPNYTGEQLITRSVIIEYVKKQLNYDARCCPMKIVGLETKDYSWLEDVDLPDGSKITVKLGGIIDRLDDAMEPTIRDEHNNYTRSSNTRFIRVVDYKTSPKEQTAPSVAALFDGENKSRAYHILQTFYYCYVLSKSGKFDNRFISPQLMYVKLLKEETTASIKIAKEEVTDFANQQIGDEKVMDTFVELLKQTIRNIFDKNQPFTQTTQEHNCTYCPFCNMCGRKVEEYDK